MKRNFIVVLFVLLVILMNSCSQDNSDILSFDKYSSYSVIYNDSSKSFRIWRYDFNFESIDAYFTKKASMAAIIRVFVYDENTELPLDKSKWWGSICLPAFTISKAKVLEVYFTSDDLKNNLKQGDYIWIGQLYCIDEASKEILCDWEPTIMIPGCEYLIYASLFQDYDNGGIYQGYGIFAGKRYTVVPLSISSKEYGDVLKRNNFRDIDTSEICEKAIEKYIHGKGAGTESG